MQLLDGWWPSVDAASRVRISRLREPTRHAPAIDLTADGRYLLPAIPLRNSCRLWLRTRNWARPPDSMPGVSQRRPEQPGVYRMIGDGDLVLYVGKAKNPKRRFLRISSAPSRVRASRS